MGGDGRLELGDRDGDLVVASVHLVVAVVARGDDPGEEVVDDVELEDMREQPDPARGSYAGELEPPS